jgi:hypothetical protein
MWLQHKIGQKQQRKQTRIRLEAYIYNAVPWHLGKYLYYLKFSLHKMFFQRNFFNEGK